MNTILLRLRLPAPALLLAAVLPLPAAGPAAVDYRFAPPEWQAAICLPDDPQKSLVDRSGELLYHYGQGGREFATRVGVQVAEGAVWRAQRLESPRTPVMRTTRSAAGLEIIEEAFAIVDLAAAPAPPAGPRRVDSGGVNRSWAKPAPGLDPSLKDIAVHMGGSVQFELDVPAGGARRVALALCEGWWKEPRKRVQLLRVEGAAPVTIDTVADLGQNRAGAFWFDGRDTNNDGRIEVSVDAAPGGTDQNTFLNGLWVFEAGARADTEGLLAGRLNGAALGRLNLSNPGGPPRNDVILVTLTNSGSAPREARPQLVVDTTHPFAFEPETGRAVIQGHETVVASLKMTGVTQKGPSRRLIQLEPLSVPAGGTASFAVMYCGGGSILAEPVTVAGALKRRQAALAYWAGAPLPYGRVEIPDPGIQALVDSSIRNIWQAREIKKGYPAFQVGPTCYRGLWIVDGAFLLESAAMLGAGSQARNGVAYELTFQQADGRIEVMRDFSKENGIVLWTCVRHARLTRDKAWLESVWPKLQRVAAHIQTLRRRSLENDTPLDDGLVPPGFPDGGIGGIHAEYTNPYWNLTGLKAFIEGAQWLGRTADVQEWQKEYDAFMASFRAAAARDLARDAHGNSYLPILMGKAAAKELPQRGQWAFCQAVYPGQIFAREDPLVAGTLAMLQATEREEMVYGTGWDATGIWNYFASFYGHALLWQGGGQKAAQALYAFANHAAPVGVWREEQSLKGEKFNKVGDMPHNWASAEFIRLVIHLLAIDRGSELHLLEGLPPAWTGPGQVTRLHGVATPFGPLEMSVKVDPDGRKATLEVGPLAEDCSAVVVHLPGGGLSRLDAAKGGSVRFPIPAATPSAPKK